MPVKNINGNSMWDVYMKKMMAVEDTVKPPPEPDELVNQTLNKDSSWDDFEDVNDDMLGKVFHLVSQYEKMGGKLRTDGPKMTGGAFGDNDEYQIEQSLSTYEKKVKIDALKRRYRTNIDTNSSSYWQERLEYFVKMRDREKPEISSQVEALLQLIKNRHDDALKREKTQTQGKEYIDENVKSIVAGLPALPPTSPPPSPPPSPPKTPPPKKPSTKPPTLSQPKGLDLTGIDFTGNTLEKKFKLTTKRGYNTEGVIDKLADLKVDIEDSERPQTVEEFEAVIVDLNTLYDIERLDKRARCPRDIVMTTLISMRDLAKQKIADIKTVQQTQEAEAKAQEAEAKAQEAETKADDAEERLTGMKEIIGDTGNTSVGGLMNVIVNVINKMVRLVKLKRNEWRSSVVLKDLKDVRDKVVQYYNKFNEMDPNDKVIKGNKESYNLTNKKMNELKDEFTLLIKSSNLNQQIYGGGRKFADASVPYVHPSKVV